jgi:hypothetical protein
MTKPIARFGLAALVLAVGATLALTQPQLIRRTPLTAQMKAASTKVGLGDAKGERRLEFIGKTVTLEGYYSNDSIPMLVDDMERTRCNEILPPESYVVLSGPPPGDAKPGDMIRVEGVLQQPGGRDAEALQAELAVLHSSPTAAAQVVKAAPPQPVQPRLEFTIPTQVLGAVVVRPEKYAVLLCGGYSSANSFYRYWNDVKWYYWLLRSRGYSDANIYVLFGSGVGRDASVHVDYPATKAHIINVFGQLATKMKSPDSLCVVVTGPGGGYLKVATAGRPAGRRYGLPDVNGDEVADVTHTDETIGVWPNMLMSDDEFAAQVNRIAHYHHMVFVLQPCYSGGFCHDLARPNRLIMTATGEWELSWCHTYYPLDEFLLWVNWGLRTPGACDANHDGKVSMAEAYNFARIRDTLPEEQWYEDNGAHPPRIGPIPAGGEGALGVATYL